MIIVNLKILFAIVAFAACKLHQPAKLPGWLGEVHGSQLDEKQQQSNQSSKNDEEWTGQVEQISWKPRAYLLHGFLTEEECDHLISVSKDRMKESSVIDRKTGKSIASNVRTSTGHFLSIGYDPIVSRIERKVAQVSRVPVSHQESMQILRYLDGQEYKPHHDYFHDAPHLNPRTGGQRLVTVLMYLSTPEEGGETVLPLGTPKVSGDGWSECARAGLAVKAVKGNALMFFGLHPDNTPDPTSLHGSCPTTKGEKWSATKWIHVGSTRPSKEEQARWSGCKDKAEPQKCSEWAASGECRKNPVYMRENCALSCNSCQTEVS